MASSATGRQHEPPRAILDHLSCRAIDRLRGDDCVVVLSSTMSLRTSVRSCSVIARFSSSAWNVKSGEYRAPVSRFRRCCNADRPRGRLHRVLGLWSSQKGTPSLLRPRQLTQALTDKGIGGIGTVPTADPRRAARLAGNADAPLRFAVVALELVPADRPVDREAVQRLETQILRGKAVRHAAPVQRRSTHRHRPRNNSDARLVADRRRATGSRRTRASAACSACGSRRRRSSGLPRPR